jgi:hypothetical protein
MVIGMLGLCLTILGIILAYIWKGNQKMEKAVLAGQERLEEGQKKGFAILEEGQKEIAQILKTHGEMLKTQTEMLLAQTRILERIEGKIPAPSVG